MQDTPLRPLGDALVVVALVAVCVAQQPPASRFELSAYAAYDSHEGVTLAAKPYVLAAELETVFGKHNLQDAGVVPVEILIINERVEPIRVVWQRALLLSAEDKFGLIEPEAIAWRLYSPPKLKLPRTWPERRKKLPRDTKRTAREAAEAALRSQHLRPSVIPNGRRARGFLYFDCGPKSSGQPLVLATARLYLPEVVVLPNAQPLFYFEVDLSPYAKATSESEQREP